jgi:hypothetical protein
MNRCAGVPMGRRHPSIKKRNGIVNYFKVVREGQAGTFPSPTTTIREEFSSVFLLLPVFLHTGKIYLYPSDLLSTHFRFHRSDRKSALVMNEIAVTEELEIPDTREGGRMGTI